MKYDVISADSHVDLIWLPPDLFTNNASAAFKDRMPYVTDGPRGKEWVTKNGSTFGLMNGMGSGGRQYIPGQIHRSDRMAAEGIYDDGKKGIRRMTDPELRLKDQDRDGVQAEVLYGILGATSRLNDDEAAGEMLRIYNEWLADFCVTHPDRFAGLACVPNHDAEAAIGEIERVARAGCARGSKSRAGTIWRRCGTPGGTRCGTRSRRPGCRCISTRSAAATGPTPRSSLLRSSSPPVPPASPTSRCRWPTCCYR